MLPNPVKIAQDQPSYYLCLLPDFGKLILMAMPSTRLLPEDAIRAL